MYWQSRSEVWYEQLHSFRLHEVSVRKALQEEEAIFPFLAWNIIWRRIAQIEECMSAQGNLIKRARDFALASPKHCVCKIPLVVHETASMDSISQVCWRLRLLSYVGRRPDSGLIRDTLSPTLPRTWRRRTGGQLKTRATTMKAGIEPLS